MMGNHYVLPLIDPALLGADDTTSLVQVQQGTTSSLAESLTTLSEAVKLLGRSDQKLADACPSRCRILHAVDSAAGMTLPFDKKMEHCCA